MYQAPATVWNEIAETQTLRTPWAEQMFPLPEEDLLQALRNEEERLEEETGSQVLAAAYLTVMPLLWEHRAIRLYQEAAGPKASLPAVESVDQALAVASGDFLLTPEERRMLARMLLVPPT